EQLSELKKMLDASATNQIPIHKEQLDFFMEKVVPGLRELGDVRFSRRIREQFGKTPLVAKLFLDRVRNRHLAGLEFQYDNISFNPLESRKMQTESMVIRDEEKENKILKLMDDSFFTKTEEGYFLHNEALEYEFLQHVLPRIQGDMQIYATTAVRNRVISGQANPKIRVRAKRERINWLEFKRSEERRVGKEGRSGWSRGE